MKLAIELDAVDGSARAGRVRTARGEFHTPVFMPVGTRASLRAVTTDQIEALGPEIVLANTYHLMLRPGAETIEALGGLHRFSSWRGHMLTDSGGFQVFSLGSKVTDDGVQFRSVYDGSKLELSPERAVRIQEQLGADIQMVLDVCSALPASRADLRDALNRTADWAATARRAFTRFDDQSQFGIVQGGTEVDLRAESAQRTVEIGFDGYAIGGLSVGEGRSEMLEALDAAIAHLPIDQPRYFMGLGDPLGVVEAISRGVDMMDCVLPTRLGRHGSLLTGGGRVNIKRAEFARSDDPIDPTCACHMCQRYSRGYLRHLMTVGEPAGATICTLHNVAWLLDLVARARRSIQEGTFASLRDEVRAVWG